MILRLLFKQSKSNGMLKILIVFLMGLMLFLPKGAFAHNKTQIVEMTPDGFVPQEVTIDQNSTVIFVNKDTIVRWPASNTHPTHEIYPEFDPRREIPPGESWPFKPKKLGTFKYHDHMFPHKRGVITVVDEAGEKEQEQKEVKNQEDVPSSVAFFSKFF